jgi:hypothetical protein
MVSIRRKLGAFVAAFAIAAVMVMVPTPLHAKGKTSTIDSFCAQLASAIAAIEALPENLVTDAVLDQLNATYTTYCGTVQP